MNTRITPVVLAGGIGSRLWPLSREALPKQLLRLQGPNSLLQQTLLRLIAQPQDREADTHVASTHVESTWSLDPAIIVAAAEHRFIIQDQLDSLAWNDYRIVLEPVGRNTAPALTMAALYARRSEEDPLLLVMPADHVIVDDMAFRRAISSALELAANGRIVTFGVVPESPETGYGYLRCGEPLDTTASAPVYSLHGFVEKPDLKTAQGYLHSGEYFWNAGLFMLRANVWLDMLKGLNPKIYRCCFESIQGSTDDGRFLRIDGETFSHCPSDSIDYAVMEKLDRIEDHGALVPIDVGWSDVGSWDALAAIMKKDAAGNSTHGDVLLKDCRDTMVFGTSRLVTGLGLEDMVVVETPDAVLVAPREKTQSVREIVSELDSLGKPEARLHPRVHRPWGSYETLEQGTRYQVKRLSVKPGAALSLQLHHHRAEHWVVVRGTARVTKGDEVFLLAENESTYIPLGTKHRLENPGRVELELIEVQSGAYLDEDDIVRFEDRYDR